MVTNQLRQILKACFAQQNGSYSNRGYVPVVTTSGVTRYISKIDYPYSVSNGASMGNGVRLGTNGTAPTVNDYALGSAITSGISIANQATPYTQKDANGDLTLEYIFTVTNTDNSAITIREIGYYQNVYTSANPGETGNSASYQVMIDRTLLDSPITIQPNEYAVIKYTLKSILGLA